MNLTALVARVGVNPYFVAFNAHCWSAAFLVRQMHGDPLIVAAVLLAAAFKEFWFDARNEVPKQTAFDNWTDFAGYAAGALIGWGFA